MSNLQNIQEHGNGDSEVVKFAIFASVYVPGKKGSFYYISATQFKKKNQEI